MHTSANRSMAAATPDHSIQSPLHSDCTHRDRAVACNSNAAESRPCRPSPTSKAVASLPAADARIAHRRGVASSLHDLDEVARARFGVRPAAVEQAQRFFRVTRQNGVPRQVCVGLIGFGDDDSKTTSVNFSKLQ